MIKIKNITFPVAVLFGLVSVSAMAEEAMDHSTHDMSKHAEHDMSQHMGHDTGAAAHIHHGHGKGMVMFEYRNMSMKMEGLLQGTDSVSTNDVSGVTAADPTATPPCTPVAGKSCMAPSEMTMNMHMFMGMYGLTDKLTLMAMTNYVKNSMDMVMHNETSGMTMTGDMETSGVSDTLVSGMYALNDSLTVSMGVSLPSGQSNTTTKMNMYMPTGMLASSVTMPAPYPMQLGSGTYDLVPSITYKAATNNFGYGGQATFTHRTSSNNSGYTLGDKLELTGWGKYVVSHNWLVSGRLSYTDWDEIDGQNESVMPMMIMMNFVNDPANSGGKRMDFLVGVSGFFGKGHMVGIEYGIPIQQDLNGTQMELDSILSVAYQYMI